MINNDKISTCNHGRRIRRAQRAHGRRIRRVQRAQRARKIFIATGGCKGVTLHLFKNSSKVPLFLGWLLSLKALKVQKQLANYTFSAMSNYLSFKFPV